MKTPIHVGDLLIVNEADRPCSRLIAIAVLVPSDCIHARYISLEHKDWPTMTISPDEAQNLRDFGVSLRLGKKAYSVYRHNTSVANYRNGKQRQWQDYEMTGVPIDINPEFHSRVASAIDRMDKMEHAS